MVLDGCVAHRGRHCSKVTAAKNKSKQEGNMKDVNLPRSVGNTAGRASGHLLGGTTCCSSSILFLLGFFVGLSIGDGLSILLVFVDSPIEDIVVLEALTNKKVAEDLSKVRVVWLIIETKGSSIVEIDGKLVRESTAEDFSWSGHLLLHDSIVLLLFGCSLKTLPRKRSTAEIEHDIAERLHIVTTRLFCFH
jgi:hypothetical protein